MPNCPTRSRAPILLSSRPPPSPFAALPGGKRATSCWRPPRRCRRRRPRSSCSPRAKSTRPRTASPPPTPSPRSRHCAARYLSRPPPSVRRRSRAPRCARPCTPPTPTMVCTVRPKPLVRATVERVRPRESRFKATSPSLLALTVAFVPWARRSLLRRLLGLRGRSRAGCTLCARWDGARRLRGAAARGWAGLGR